MAEHNEWSNQEIIRAIGGVEDTLKDIRLEMKAERERFLPRETYEVAVGALKDWRGTVGAEIVDLDADLARFRREVDDQFRAERAERVVAVRWGIGIGVTTFFAMLGLFITVVSNLGQ